jgi:hypothetical protein
MWKKIFPGAACICLFLSLSGCSYSSITAGEPLTLRVDSNGVSVDVTYLLMTNGKNEQSQQNGTSPKWETEIPIYPGLVTYALTAQSGEGGGYVTCAVWRGDKLLASNTSNGQYSVVTCSGNVE